jgi:hypothetical protein
MENVVLGRVTELSRKVFMVKSLLLPCETRGTVGPGLSSWIIIFL